MRDSKREAERSREREGEANKAGIRRGPKARVGVTELALCAGALVVIAVLALAIFVVIPAIG